MVGGHRPAQLADPRDASALGLRRVLERYRTGVLVDAGGASPPGAYQEVLQTARERGVVRLPAVPGSAISVGPALLLEALDVTPREVTLGQSPTPSSGPSPNGAAGGGPAGALAGLPVWRLRWGDFSLLAPGDGPDSRLEALLAAGPPPRCAVLLLTERAAESAAVVDLVRAVAPQLVVVQGRPPPGALPASLAGAYPSPGRSRRAIDPGGGARAGGGEVAGSPDSGSAPLWHRTAIDGPLHLEVRPGAFRVAGGPWRPLTPSLAPGRRSILPGDGSPLAQRDSA